jgi:hypothetical protein
MFSKPGFAVIPARAMNTRRDCFPFISPSALHSDDLMRTVIGAAALLIRDCHDLSSFESATISDIPTHP